ncbi:MAG: purine-nucleoside phosphorylase [Actinomycetia bacterium]|nr:purine-nucleoside phosphorylase [Actinomycetes bacterium]
MDPWELAKQDSQRLQDALGGADVAVVLGSGWADVGRSIGEVGGEIKMDELEGVPAPTVQGHGATISALDFEGRRVLVLAGRAHLYEGHDAHTVVHAVRCSVLAGCRAVLLTNAAGSLRAEVGVGTPVVLTDHINMSGVNPQVGPPPPESMGPRFPDLTNLYSHRLRELALNSDDSAVEGVYAGLLGGSFETPAEIRMLASLGADVVGMSTVLEAIAARHLGAEVFGVSLVTNLAAGLQPELDHTEVLAAGAEAAPRLAGMLRAVVAGA